MTGLSDTEPCIRRISYLLTERCSIRCRHCVYGLGTPTRRGADMVASELLDWMDQALAMGIGEFCFTGGEPFLAYQTLRQAVVRAAERGATAGVITNAFWATSEEVAIQRLEPLRGLQEISISADRFHQEHIPLDRVRHTIKAARALGIPPRVKIAYTDDREVTALRDALADILLADEIDADAVRNVGHMAQEVQSAPPLPADALENGCQATVRAPTVLPNGEVCGCCGPIVALRHDHPMWLGNLRQQDLSEIVRNAEMNVVYQLIRLRGPYALYELVAADVAVTELDMSSPCALCYSLLEDPGLCRSLVDRSSALSRQLAVERLFCFHEPAMLARLPLGEGVPEGAGVQV